MYLMIARKSRVPRQMKPDRCSPEFYLQAGRLGGTGSEQDDRKLETSPSPPVELIDSHFTERPMVITRSNGRFARSAGLPRLSERVIGGGAQVELLILDVDDFAEKASSCRM
jgi:hypothetical protein